MKVSSTELKFLDTIANSVDSYLKSKNKKINSEHELFRIIARSLPHLTPGMEFNVYVRQMSNLNEDPFIMAIYPDLEELDVKSKSLIELMNEGKTQDFLKEWAEIKKWAVEIDSRILTKGNPLCVDDGRQFVAIMCHELGHALGGNPLRLIENYIYQQKVSNKIGDMIISKNPMVRKFALPMFVHTLQFKIILKNGASNLKEEIRADHYIPNEYREDFIAYIEHHILPNPAVSKIVVSGKEFDNQQTVSIRFSKEVVSMMRHRRDVLKNSIKAQYDNDNSDYMRNMVTKIGKSSMGYDTETGETNSVFEGSMLRCLESDLVEYTNSVQTMLEAASVTARDISILQVQAEDINTVEQKLFVVHTIYDYIEILQTQKEKMLKKSSNPELLIQKGCPQDIQIKTLNEILEKVMKKDVSNVGDRYGIFIKYPKGYEG